MRMRVMLPACVLALLLGAEAFADPVMVVCGRGQHTVVRDTLIRGQAVTRVECVTDVSPRLVANRRLYETRYTRPRRSWGKSALIIGGSAGTGAGIGGIVKGKKGALIGAALGGGVGSLYEGARRR